MIGLIEAINTINRDIESFYLRSESCGLKQHDRELLKELILRRDELKYQLLEEKAKEERRNSKNSNSKSLKLQNA